MAKCLIVDDVDVTKFSTGLILKDMGVESDVAGNVQEAISALGSNTYDVVILDWCIGKDSGIDLLKRMRLDLGVRSPVIVLSGVMKQSSSTEVTDAGGDAFIEKPATKENNRGGL